MMSTGTITPYQPGQRAGHDGFAQLLRAEWTKFRTVRGWVIGMVVAALVTVLVGLLGHSSCGIINPNGKTSACPAPPRGPGGEAVTDNFYFVHQPLAGDGTITVRMTSLTGQYSSGNIQVGQGPQVGMKPGLQEWAKAGIIIKENTKQGSAYAAMMVTGSHGVRMQYDYTHDTAGLAGAVSPASPRWLRLSRAGDTITGYESADGTHWTQVGTATLAGLPSTVQAGLFAASPPYSHETAQGLLSGSGTGGPALATAAFDHVSLGGTRPSGAWSGVAAGSSYDALPGLEGFHQAGGRFTVSGTGDIAPNVPSAPGGGPGIPFERTLVGAFAGLIAVAVVGTMFITAEYRRGLIRTTLAASPRRGRVLAAKATVIGAVAFAAGLAGAAIAVPVGERILRGSGNYILPVTTLTELRVIVGIAALIAVAAVLALAIGTMLRRSAGAVTAVIVAIVLPYFLALTVLPIGVADWLLRVTPAAGFAIEQSMPQYPQVTADYTPAAGYFPLAPWAGFAVLCGWAALALGLAVVLLRRRDA
jgi:ABC-type transport system involved in multi-copper enzyme maturation permease subunit/regulation of enolase protein 1 (concanavalin A-like superfamily)